MENIDRSWQCSGLCDCVGVGTKGRGGIQDDVWVPGRVRGIAMHKMGHGEAPLLMATLGFFLPVPFFFF